jgi:hypothetical protein
MKIKVLALMPTGLTQVAKSQVTIIYLSINYKVL